jgi:hypothetical protein
MGNLNQMQRVAIFAAAGAGATENVYNDTTLHQAVISADKSANPLVPYLPPILHNSKNTVSSQASAAEVTRVQCLNLDDETLATSTRYQVLIEQQETKYESASDPIGKYAYTTPTVTLGSAALDRANLVTILVDKINAHASNRVTAYAIQKIAFGTGSVAEPVYGETVSQAVTLYTGTIVKVEITSGTFATNDAVGYLYLYSASGTMAITSVITASGGGTMAPTAAGVPSQDILLIDDGSYFRSGNKGYTTAINGDNFTYHTVTEIRAAVYERGIGTHMLADVPVFDESGQKLISGSMEYYTSGAQVPVSGSTYTRAEITCFRPGVLDPMSNVPSGEYETTMICWVAEDGNTANFLATLAAAIV